MSKPRKAERSVLLFLNERKPAAAQAAAEVRRLLVRAGARVRAVPASFRGAAKPPRPQGRRPSPFCLAVVIGGDGTMLRAARVLAGHGVPLLGVNTGGLGFLNAVDMSGFRRNLRRILEGGFSRQQRRLLCVEVFRGGRRAFGPYAALNDCVLRSGGQARAVVFRAYEAGRYIAEYFGDGLIVATPTGSTAYALAAGGPVVHPELPAVLLAPICPHTLAQRPLILPASAPLRVRLERKNAQDRPKGVVSVDGQIEKELVAGDEVVVQPWGPSVDLLFDPRRSHFEVLRTKLRWGER